jgi:hypothetical protein
MLTLVLNNTQIRYICLSYVTETEAVPREIDLEKFGKREQCRHRKNIYLKPFLGRSAGLISRRLYPVNERIKRAAGTETT